MPISINQLLHFAIKLGPMTCYVFFNSTPRSVLVLLLGISVLVVPALLHAQATTTMNLGPKTTGVYYGLAAGQASYQQDFENPSGFLVEEEIEVSTVELRTGLSYNRWVSLEARVGSGDQDSTRIGSSSTKASFDMGLYQNFLLKIKYPTYVQPYVLLGLSHTDTELCQDGTDCESSINWRPTAGGGLLLPIRGDLTSGIYAEALAYDESSRESRVNAELEQVNFGLMVGF